MTTAKILLLRAYAETSSNGYYSPLHRGNCPTLLPIPEEGVLRAKPWFMDPRRTRSPCTGEPLSTYYPVEHAATPIHNDPRLDLGLYTDYYMPGGRLPSRPGKRLGRGDVLLFMAGLAQYPDEAWRRPRSLREQKRLFDEARRRGRAAVYLVGGIVVEEIVDTGLVGWEKAVRRHPVLACSPHYYRVMDEPVAVLGRGFTLQPPPRISCGRGPCRGFTMLLGDAALGAARNNYRRTRVVEWRGNWTDFLEELAATLSTRVVEQDHNHPCVMETHDGAVGPG